MELRKKFAKFYKLFKDKKYCILVYLKNAQRVKPFKVNKSGYGAMAAWLVVDNVNRLKVVCNN